MNLKSLELLGFKSFAKKTILTFNAPVTAVVGPNGSGKSNVAEAFRWCLGEQSIKSLRGKRGEDLIFNGTAGAPKQNHAYVEVVFDNRERQFNIDFDEVAIARHVYRDGSNQYFINGTQVRLKDVVELLSAVSLGVSSHHIISQGEADRILNANMYERREMIEDALGLKVFQYKKEESARKLDKTEANIKEVESLRRELAPHIRFLRKQVEQVKKAEDMKVELVGLYKEYLKREELYLKSAREAIAKEKNPPQAELARIEAELAKLSSVLSSAPTVTDATKRDELRAIERELYDAQEKKNSAEREIGRLDALIEINSETKDEPLYIKINEGGQKVCKYCGQAVLDTQARERHDFEEEKNRKVAELREKRADVEEVLAKIAETISALSERIRAERESIESKKDEFRDSERSLYELRAKRSDLLSALNSLRSREETLLVEENNFKMELTEAGVLAGREALNYAGFLLPDGSLPVGEEPRAMQEDRRRKIERIKIRLEDMGGVSDDVMKEHNDAEAREKFLEKEVADLLKSAGDLKALMEELSEKINTEFKKGVEKINVQFQEFFTLMFDGGSASLSIVLPEKKKSVENIDLDKLEEEPAQGWLASGQKIEEGIDIIVNLPRKRIKGLQMLSGGERALTSIALLFAVSQVNPPPFLILDETDAALDESNSCKYGDMLENLSKVSQLIVITHNRETMSRAGIIYGVTMRGDGISKLLSIKFDEAVVIAK